MYLYACEFRCIKFNYKICETWLISIDGNTEYLMGCIHSNVGSKLLQVVEGSSLRSWYNIVQSLVVGWGYISEKKIGEGGGSGHKDLSFNSE